MYCKLLAFTSVKSSPPWLGILCWCSAPLHGWACCAGAWSTAMVGRAMLLLGPNPWSGPLCRRVGGASMVGHAVLVLDPSPWSRVLCSSRALLHRRARGAGARSAVMVGHALLLPGLLP